MVKHGTIRLLLCKAASKKMQVKQLDVKTAFLHREIQEDQYMEKPEGYIDPKPPNLVYKLQKGLYGLKQGSTGLE